MARLICIAVPIALLLCVAIVHCLDEDLLDESRDEETLLTAFDLAYIRRLKDESAKLVSIGTDLEVAQKIGLLALYFRLFKKFVPVVHKQGLKYLFPEPTVDVDPDLAKKCKEGLVKCINALHRFYSTTHPWLFGKSSSDGSKTFKGGGFFRQVINDNQLSFETTAMQLLCYFTTSGVPLFRFIPFCAFDIDQLEGNQMEMFSPFMDKDFFDEAIGMPYECAMKSFCPDVCCRSVPEIWRDVKPFTALCRMNPCRAQEWERCTLEPNKNDDLFAIRKNNWNATCPCDSKAEIFRADIQQCVAHNPCYKENLCEVNEKCVNVYGGEGINDGYLCVCQLGYIKTDTGCEPIALNLKAWHGLAHSESMLQEDSETPIRPVILPLAVAIIILHLYLN